MRFPLNKDMSNDEIAQVFEFVGQVLGMRDDQQFRSRAYEEAGVVIHQVNQPLAKTYAQLQKKDPEHAAAAFLKEVDALPGIGESIAAKLLELFSTGKIKAFDKYVKELPGGMFPLAQLYGIGAKKAFILCQTFHLQDPDTAIEKLLAKAEAGKVRNLPGFGEKSEAELIETLQEQHKKSRIPYQHAFKVATELQTALKKLPGVQKVIFLGSLRRHAKTVGDIDMGAIITDVDKVKPLLSDLKLVDRVLAAGDNMFRVVLKNKWQVDIKLSTPAEWGSFVQHFTGSKEHNIHLRELAQSKDLSLSEHGIKNTKTGKTKKFSTEADFYKYLGLKLIPPEERIGKDELEEYQLTAKTA